MEQPMPIYRIDRFSLPATARDSMLQILAATHGVLQTQPGFRRQLIAERNDDDGVLHLVTLVEWEAPEHVLAAREAVARRHAELGFDRDSFLRDHAVRMDPGLYTEVAL
jgi:heme-degrading monooxygenase HmoA